MRRIDFDLDLELEIWKYNIIHANVSIIFTFFLIDYLAWTLNSTLHK